VTALFLLILATGIAPLAAGLLLLKPSSERSWPSAGSVLLCTLAFNLTFFWQELWLVIPKALTPGLHPVLYHNNHDWTGNAPVAELLQGSGAVATLLSGLAFCCVLATVRRASSTWRLFFFWMAFQGLYQSLTQLAIGTQLPGNDVGRALRYLEIGAAGKVMLLVLAVAAMAFAGIWLARRAAQPGTRRSGYEMLLVALLSVVLVIPFRLPRNIIEVAFIPLIVNLVGIGWLILGKAIVPNPGNGAEQRLGIAGPLIALCGTLLVFQLVLRPGIAF
jgi:hypothetical protein